MFVHSCLTANLITIILTWPFKLSFSGYVNILFSYMKYVCITTICVHLLQSSSSMPKFMRVDVSNTWWTCAHFCAHMQLGFCAHPYMCTYAFILECISTLYMHKIWHLLGPIAIVSFFFLLLMHMHIHMCASFNLVTLVACVSFSLRSCMCIGGVHVYLAWLKI